MANSDAAESCGHPDFEFREIDGKTWHICVGCDFRERWEGGMLCETTDEAASALLDATESKSAWGYA